MRNLVNNAGFEVVAMIGHGREHPHQIPPEWRTQYEALGFREKTRINELLSEGGGSYNMILRRKAT